MASTTLKRSALANTVKYHPDDHEAIAAARADLAVEKLAGWIERALAAAPPLSEPQLSRLRALLAPAGGDGDAA
jgi:hypothetical protein